tara:strand:- start:19 stop:327 length:309 start_codon:yes stop_codon:yes gene_type:complete
VQDAAKKLTFDPTINLGHILTAISFLVVGTAGYVAMDGRVTNLERADVVIESRLLREIAAQRVHMDQIQMRTSEDIREIKSIVRDGFRDLDGKLEKKAEKPR